MNTITDTTLQYTFENTVAISENLVGEANTYYEVSGDYQVDLPPVADIPGGTVIGMKQISGTGVLYQNSSEFGLDGSDRAPSSVELSEGDIAIAYLAYVFGRKVWYLLPDLLEPTNILSDAEKTKLAGIEAGATADQTPAEILAAWQSESGHTASGLDSRPNFTDLGSQSGEFNIDFSLGKVLKITIVGDIILTGSNLSVGDGVMLWLDNSGGYNVDYSAFYVDDGGGVLANVNDELYPKLIVQANDVSEYIITDSMTWRSTP